MWGGLQWRDIRTKFNENQSVGSEVIIAGMDISLVQFLLIECGKKATNCIYWHASYFKGNYYFRHVYLFRFAEFCLDLKSSALGLKGPLETRLCNFRSRYIPFKEEEDRRCPRSKFCRAHLSPDLRQTQRWLKL